MVSLTEPTLRKFTWHVILPPSLRSVRERHVTRRLLKVGHQSAPFEDLRENVRDAFTGDVSATELCHGIISVFVEHSPIEFLSSCDTHCHHGAGAGGGDI